jgi:hypothetical protein
MKRTLALFAGLILLMACQVQAGIPYTRMENYYVRNDAKLPIQARIDDRATFESLFGMATLMGTAGQPTPVDWDNEFVLAVVDPSTNIQTELVPESLQCENGQLVFTYSETVGEKQSFWIIPELLLKVDRRYEAESVRFVRQQKKSPGPAASENE